MAIAAGPTSHRLVLTRHEKQASPHLQLQKMVKRYSNRYHKLERIRHFLKKGEHENIANSSSQQEKAAEMGSIVFGYCRSNNGQVAQLSHRDRAAGCVSFGQKWKTGTGRQYFKDIIGLSSTTVT